MSEPRYDLGQNVIGIKNPSRNRGKIRYDEVTDSKIIRVKRVKFIKERKDEI